MKQQVQEIFEKYDGGNAFVVREMHYYLAEKQFAKAKNIMVKELYISEEDAKILIAYYKKKLSNKVSLVEINASEVEVSDPDDVDPQYYLFFYGQGIYHSSVHKSYRNEEDIEFYGEKGFHSITKARQIWRIQDKD